MAGIWADFPSGSHGLYGADRTAALDGVWLSMNDDPVDDPDPTIGSAGKVLSHDGDPRASSRFAIPSPSQQIGMGHRLWIGSLPTSGHNFVTFNSIDNQILYTLRLLPSGAMELYRGTGGDTAVGTLIVTTGSPVITASAWWHLEYFFDTSTGEIEVRRNGVAIADLTFTDGSPPTGVDSGEFGMIGFPARRAGSVDQGFRSKDIVAWDTSGSQVNDFQGSVSVFFNPVVLDIATTGWGFSSGSDASALIGHVGPPVDTDYISADDTPPAPASMELADLPPDITSVRFIVPVVRAAKVDGGDGNIQLALTPNGSDYDTGPDTPITTAFTYWGNAASPFVSHLNPATSAAWTPADFTTGIDLRIDRTV